MLSDRGHTLLESLRKQRAMLIEVIEELEKIGRERRVEHELLDSVEVG